VVLRICQNRRLKPSRNPKSAAEKEKRMKNDAYAVQHKSRCRCVLVVCKYLV
jgi:hypothetical protein